MSITMLQRPQQQGAISAKQIQRKKILIVDDDEDIASTLKLALECDGRFEVDTFCQPDLALASFDSGVYDIILLDINMPILNGFQLYTELRKIDERVKICFITASSELSLERFQHAECLIPKPIESQELIKRIEAQLNS